jgi:hypothetical protein
MKVAAVDILNERRDLILLLGQPERLQVQGMIRGLLQLERVRFIDQVKPDEAAYIEETKREAADVESDASQLTGSARQ